MEKNLTKLVIRISAYIFLLLGFAVVFVEFWFNRNNKISNGLAISLAVLCAFIFILILLFYLNKKYDFFGLSKNEEENK